MKVFLCFAFEKGELQRGHLSPDKESRELFAKCRGETLITSMTDKHCCWVSSCPPCALSLQVLGGSCPHCVPVPAPVPGGPAGLWVRALG